VIYFAMPPTGSIKIGCSADVPGRLEGLEHHYGVELALLATMEGDRSTEAEIHRRFHHHRLGRTEQFRSGADLMDFIGRPLFVNPDPDAIEAIPPRSKLAGITIQCSRAWKEWIVRGAKYCRTDVSKLVDMALVEYLKNRGFGEEAPER
jgi:hypothetical protein